MQFMQIRLSAFADEAADDFGKQLRILQKERIPYIELRGVDGKNVAALTENEVKRCAEMLRDAEIRVWAVGSPLGKISLKDDFSAHLETAKRIFAAAKILGTDKIRVFSFYTAEPQREETEIFARMTRLAALAKEYGVFLYHENEKEIYGDTPQRVKRLLGHVNGLKCVFDPANFVQCGEDVSKAIDLLREDADYYHIKDALSSSGEVVPSGEGDGQIDKIVSGIKKDTVLTLEPHLAAFKGYSEIDHTQLKGIKVYRSSEEAFSAAADALRKILRKNNFKEENGIWKK